MDAETKKMIQKLQEMKKEVARKQKKLERARRAARVKAHVRKKIKEHEANQINSTPTPSVEDANFVYCNKNIKEDKLSQEETKEEADLDENSCSISRTRLSCDALTPKNQPSIDKPEDVYSKSHHCKGLISQNMASLILNP
ncbi:hypothetical protein EGW08_015898, partial [Elysia chlorotica]